MEFLGELLHDLHIDPPVILVNIIGFLILLGLMRRFFFGPVGQFLADRRQDVAQTVESAEVAKQQAEEQLASLQSRQDEMLAQAQQEANQARQQGQVQADELVSEARQEALERERRAAEQIEKQQAEALAEARGEVAGLSVQFAQSVLREALSEGDQQALLEAAVKEVEALAQRQAK